MINCTMLKRHLTERTLWSVQASRVAQSPQRGFSATARNHPRHGTSTRGGRWADNSSREVVDTTERTRPSEGRPAKFNRKGSGNQVKSRDDFFRSFEGAAAGRQPRQSFQATRDQRVETDDRERLGRSAAHGASPGHLSSGAYYSSAIKTSVGLHDSVPSGLPEDGSQHTIMWPNDIWTSQTVYLDSSSRTRSPLHVDDTGSSPPTSFATTFFAASRPTFLYSSDQLRTTPTNSAIPEIAIVGASNVGKSSFLNALVTGLAGQPQQSETKLAHTSKRAGHTRTLNAYGVGPSVSNNPVLASRIKKKLRAGSGEVVPNHSLVLVDTPGYGFRSRKEWGDGVIGFLEKRTMLKGVVLLIAAEKDGLSQFDLEVLRMVSSLDKGVLIIVTKGDKFCELSRQKLKKAKKSGVEGDRSYLNAVMVERLQDIEERAKWACRVNGPEQRLIPRIYLTAADMPRDKKWKVEDRVGNKGIAGARAAILELAGLAEPSSVEPASMDDIVPEKRAGMANPEAWSGEVIPFEELEKMYEKKDK